jgi:hypothetical protein
MWYNLLAVQENNVTGLISSLEKKIPATNRASVGNDKRLEAK